MFLLPFLRYKHKREGAALCVKTPLSACSAGCHAHARVHIYLCVKPVGSGGFSLSLSLSLSLHRTPTTCMRYIMRSFNIGVSSSGSSKGRARFSGVAS